MSDRPLTLGRLAVAGLWHRRRAAALLSLSLGLSAALLSLGVHALSAIHARTQPPPALGALILGPPGGGLPLALCGAWFLLPCPGLLSPGALAAVEAEPSLRQAVPFAAGDALGAQPVIATVSEAFAEGPGGLRLMAGAPLATRRAALQPWLDGGPAPAAAPALVLGATAAARLGLGIGGAARLQHGAEGAAHGPPWTVVGLLAPTGGPVDEVIFADLGAFVGMDEHQGGARGVSGAWLRPRSGVHKAILRARLSAMPGLGVADLLLERQRLADRLGLGAQVAGLIAALGLLALGLAAAAAAAAGVEARRRELALYVLLGARPAQLLALLLGESALIGLVAGLGGPLLARLIWAALRSPALRGPGLALPSAAGPELDLAVAVVFAALSAAAALPVAWRATRGRAQEELGAAG